MIMFIFAVLLMPVTVFGKDYFTAAVVEHTLRNIYDPSLNSTELVELNLKYYVNAAREASKHKADIILFPEYGIPGLKYWLNRTVVRQYGETIPNPKKAKVNPCFGEKSKGLLMYTLSCLARDLKMYVVANALHIKKCKPDCDTGKRVCADKCPEDGYYMHNTDVAFDREGYLIARYHKNRLFFEVLNTPSTVNYETFDTEFGRFGLMVCFDAVFKETATLVKDYGVDVMLYPTLWMDEGLILQAHEWQQSWALDHNVTVMAACTQQPNTGSLGSGIYSKDSGALVYTYENDGYTKLLLANVSVKGQSPIPQNNTITVIGENENFQKTAETGDTFPEVCYTPAIGPPQHYTEYRCPKDKLQNYTLTKLNSKSGDVEICNNGFCCSLKYLSKDLKDEFYFGAFSGLDNSYSYFFWHERACILTRCDPFEGKECVLLPPTSKTIFDNLEIRAKFEDDDIYATVTKTGYRLAPKSEWSYQTVDSETILKFQSHSNVPFLKAALLARNYTEDPTFVPYF